MALKEEFIRRFADFKAIEGQFNLLSSPFVCDIETTTEELQMELIDLQADNSLKRMFESKPLVWVLDHNQLDPLPFKIIYSTIVLV